MQYISNTEQDKIEMLSAIGVRSFDELIEKVPKNLRNFQLAIPQGISEIELTRQLSETGSLNKSFKTHACYLGGGVYDHYVPAVVSHLVLRGEFITSYTPYQGEASQGNLQAIYEFQSLMCELTGMDYSNASMYDGASALAEAVLLAVRHNGKKKVIVPCTLHPEYKSVINTYTSCLDVEFIEAPMKDAVTDIDRLASLVDDQTSAVIIQQPNFFGFLEDVNRVSEIAHAKGALLIACVNPVSLGVLEAPGRYGADICVGEGQPLGNAVSYGGPHFGFFTVKENLLRKVPGRICGMTVDKVGRRAFVLTLQAREQHIRREKATSNICTNHALCALKATIYLSLLGKEGLRRLALLNLKNAHETYERLLKIKGVKEFSKKAFFNEFTLAIDKDRKSLKTQLDKQKVLGPLDLAVFYPEFKNAYCVAVTEKRSDEDLKRLSLALEAAS